MFNILCKLGNLFIIFIILLLFIALIHNILSNKLILLSILEVRSLAFEKCGCSRYLDKIYKILVDILDLKARFPLANFFIRSNFFRSKTIKRRIFKGRFSLVC